MNRWGGVATGGSLQFHALDLMGKPAAAAPITVRAAEVRTVDPGNVTWDAVELKVDAAGRQFAKMTLSGAEVQTISVQAGGKLRLAGYSIPVTIAKCE